MVLNFEDVYGVKLFLSDSDIRVLKVNSVSPVLEKARLEKILCSELSQKERHIFVLWTDVKKQLSPALTSQSVELIVISLDTVELDDENTLKDFIEKWLFEDQPKKIILLLPLMISLSFPYIDPRFSTEHVVENISFKDLTKDTKELLFMNPCIIFHNVPYSIKEFLFINNMSDIRLNNIFNSTVLEQLSLKQWPQFQIDLNQLKPIKDKYIPRQFYHEIFIGRTLLMKQLVKDDDISDVFIIAGVKSKEDLVDSLKYPKKLADKLHNSESMEVYKDFTQAFDRFNRDNSMRPVHLLTFQDNGDIRWLDSKYSIDNIRSSENLSKNNPMGETALRKKRIFVLSGTSGSGKSMTLYSLAASKSDEWVIAIDLADWLESINKISNQNDATNFLASCIGDHPLIKGILADVLDGRCKRTLHLIFDNFDQIYNKNAVERLLEIWRSLKLITTISIGVGVRSDNCRIVEDALCSFNIQFQEFNMDQQKEYLYEHWAQKIERFQHNEFLLSQYVEHFHEILIKSGNNMGIPLLLNILVKVAQPTNDYFANPSTFHLSTYKNLQDIFRKIAKDDLQINSSEIDLNQSYGDMAYKYFFTELSEMQGDSLKFKHLVFAEYFLAEYINEKIDDLTILRLLVSRIFIEDKFKGVRLFLNSSMNLDGRYTQDLCKLWRNEKHIFFNKNHQWAMHIMVKENLLDLTHFFLNESFLKEAYILLTAKDANSKNILHIIEDSNLVEDILNIFNKLSTAQKLELMWSTLIPNSDWLEKFKAHRWVPYIEKHLAEYKNIRQLIHQRSDVLDSIEDPIACTQILQSEPSILHKAASNGQMETVEYLLKKGAFVDCLNPEQATAFLLGATYGHLEVMKLLLANGADVNVQDVYARTALLMSAKNGYLHIVNYLLETNLENIDCCDRNGISALEHACKSGHLAIVRKLITANCNVNHRDKFGMSALAWAVRGGHQDVTIMLINESKADLNIINKHGMNLVNIASKANQWNLVKLLSFCSIGVNIPDHNGMTSLDRTIKCGKWDMVQYLVLEGANVSSHNIKAAVAANKLDIALLMVKHNGEIEDEIDIILNYITKHTPSDILYQELIRLGNVDLLQHALTVNDQMQNLDCCLAVPYEKLNLIGIDLREDMKNFIECTLVRTRSLINQNLRLSEKEVDQRVALVCEEIKYIVDTQDMDVKRLEFIAQNLEIIKRTKYLSSFPLEQIQFCLVLFVNVIKKPQTSKDFHYRLLLDKHKIIQYLSCFAKSDFSDISLQLKNDFQIARDIYSLSRITSYIDLSTSLEDTEDYLKPYVLMRCIQVIGESLKDTASSANMSEGVHKYLLQFAPKGLKDILTSLRNCLSHSHTFITRFSIENRLSNPIFLRELQNDLRKIKVHIDVMLYEKKLQCIVEFSKKDTQLMGEYVYWTEEEDDIEIDYRTREILSVKSLVSQLNKLLRNKNKEHEIRMGMKLQKEITSIEENLAKGVAQAKSALPEMQLLSFTFPSKDIVTAQSRIIKAASRQRAKIYEKAIFIVHDLINSVKYDQEISAVVYQLYWIMNFQANKINLLSEIDDNLVMKVDENAENITGFDHIFRKIEDMLEVDDDKEELKRFVADQMKIHQISKKLIPPDEISKLTIVEAPVKKRLLKFFGQKKLNNFYTGLGAMNQFKKLLEEANKKSFHTALDNFFASTKNRNIEMAGKRFIEEEKLQIDKICSFKLDVLRRTTVNKSDKNNEKLQAALEILLTDTLEVLLDKKILGEYVISFDEYSPIPVTRALRNYLAHGNILIDSCFTDPYNATIATVSLLKDALTAAKMVEINAKDFVFRATDEVMNSNDFEEFTNTGSTNLELLNSFLSPSSSEIASRSSEVKLSEIRSKLTGCKIENSFDRIVSQDDIQKFHLLLGERDVNLQTCFQVAVKYGSVNIVEYILDRVLAVDILPRANQKHILHLVAMNGYTELVNKFLAYNVDVDEVDQHGSTSLHVAARHGQIEVVKILLAHHANPNALDNYKNTPLFKGIFSGDKAIVQELLDRQVQVNITNSDGKTPISLAVWKNSLELVKQMIRNQANVNIPDKNNITPLYLAAAHNFEDIVGELLLSEADINIADKNGNTPLFIAATMGHERVVKQLLEHGATTETRNKDNVTPLFLAAMIGKEAVVKQLVEHGADTTSINTDGLTPVLVAAAIGHAGVVRVLLENANSVTRSQTLLFAAKNGHNAIVEDILGLGDIIIDYTDLFLATPLLYAAEYGHCSIVKLLLDSNAQVNRRRIDMKTSLFLASENGHEEIVKILIKRGAQVDQVAKDHMSPLCAAAFNGHESVVLQLLQAGAIDRQSPLNLAAQRGHLSIVKLLLQHYPNADKNKILFNAAVNGQTSVVRYLLDSNINVNWNPDNELPLMAASLAGHEKVVELLVTHNTKVDVADKNEVTPLLLASATGKNVVVEILLKNHANIEARDNMGGTPLLVAVLQGHVEVIKTLIAHGADVNAKNKTGETSLSLAVSKGNAVVVGILLENGADNDDVRLLFKAIAKGYGETIECLIDHGASINASDATLITPLQLAIFSGNEKIIRLLLKHEPQLDISFSDGSTPLHLAVETNQIEIVKLLLDHGANINAVNIKTNETALFNAISNNNLDIAELLLDKGADCVLSSESQTSPLLKAVTCQQSGIVERLLQVPSNINIPNNQQVTPLIAAILTDNISIMELLLNHGANPDTLGPNGIPPLHLTVLKDYAMISLLLEKGADIDIRDSDGNTALHLVAGTLDDTLVLELLISRGADVNAFNECHYTPLANAVSLNKDIQVSFLLNERADVNTIGVDGRTPLRIAIDNNNFDVMMLLLNNNANPNIGDTKNNTPVHTACRQGNHDLVRILVEFGADINARNCLTQTPLAVAVYSKHKKVVEQLLSLNADINLTYECDMTSLHLAIMSGNGEIVNSLLCHGVNVVATDQSSNSPLHLAITANNNDLVALLLKYGAKLDTINSEGLTPFGLAIQNNQEDIINTFRQHAKTTGISLGQPYKNNPMCCNLS